MSAVDLERAARAQYEAAVRERLVETTGIWRAFAEERKFRYVEVTSGLPAFEASIEGTLVAVSGVGSMDLGFHTRVIADAKYPLHGKVKVAPPGDWDDLIAHVKHRDFFEAAALDEALVVRSSSQSLAHTVLDERVTKTLSVLAPARVDLIYENGSISLMWSGVERALPILDDVLEMTAYLAIRGSETSPYR
jgi:hypothetical protein